MGNTTLPRGSVLMGPNDFGFRKGNGAHWSPIDMSGVPYLTGRYANQTLSFMHQNHIHVGWGACPTCVGLPAY
jgi:hypothetical protein